MEFSPIYDNGASLGFRFDDIQLVNKTLDEQEMSKYMKNTKVKAGLFEKKSVKAKYLLKYIQKHYPSEFRSGIDKLMHFDLEKYQKFIKSLDLLSDAQRLWLQNIIAFRRTKILDWIRKEEMNNE